MSPTRLHIGQNQRSFYASYYILKKRKYENMKNKDKIRKRLLLQLLLEINNLLSYFNQITI